MILATAAVAVPYAMTVTQNVAVTMRDGTVLRADIYRPSAPGRFPVILSRTPYGKDGFDQFAQEAVPRGYVVVVEDVRGRFGSQGSFDPFVNESADGYDSVEWAARLPFCDGRVAMYGESYLGITQWLAALARPPHLAAIVPIYAPSDLHEGALYQGGAFEQLFAQSWSNVLARNAYAQTQAPFAFSQALPIDGFPAAARLAVPYYSQWLAHPDDDAYWTRWQLDGRYGRILVPSYVVGGWYDIFLDGAIREFEGMREDGGTARARELTRLRIVPGGHTGFHSTIGAVDFGPQADLVAPDAPYRPDDDVLRWLDYVVKGIDDGAQSEPVVRYFVLGEDDWRSANRWPPSGSTPTTYYLASRGAANTASGDGRLTTTEPPAGGASDRFTYDPASPVPTFGGALCCGIPAFPRGARDQSAIERRSDVLVYSTSPLEAPLLLAGPVRATLYASTDVTDTDFTAKLVDVWPNGFAQNLCDGIVRARYRRSAAKPTLLQPGQVVRYEIAIGSTASYLAPGHRLRLEVSGSNFPRFDRNLNTGGDQASGTAWKAANSVVYHDAAYPSSLTLSVLHAPGKPST